LEVAAIIQPRRHLSRVFKSTGCGYTGTFTARLSDVTLFDAAFHFGAAPCFIPNQTAWGIAFTSACGLPQ